MQARYYVIDKAPEVFAGFFDTELGVPCDFLRASDGKLRCLPRQAAASTHLGYADDQCSRDVWQISPTCADEVAYVRRRLGCQDTFAVHEFVPHSSDDAIYISLDSGCIVNDSAPYLNAFTSGDEVDPSTFVAGTLKDLPGVCHAALRVVEAEDGSFGPHQLVDRATGAACIPGDGTCSPLRVAYEASLLFSDDACTDAVSYATWLDEPSCAPPDFVRGVGNDYIYEVGDVVETEVFTSYGDCAPARDQPWIGTLFEIGGMVSKDGFAEFSSFPEGSGRVQVQLVGEGTTPLIHNNDDLGFFDREFGRTCLPYLFEDGTTRCIPADIIGGGFPDEYDDPDCTQPLRTCGGEECEGLIVFDQVVAQDSCSTERVVPAVWRLEAPSTGYYVKYGDTCTEAGETAPDRWRVSPIPPDDLAPLQVATKE